MTLLAPWALWLSAVGGVVVALYLLKIKRRRQTVPALDFWRELAGTAPVRSLFQRLKRWWSMLLWIVIVGCLMLAIGNPIFTLGRIKPRAIAVILDNSASMQTIEADFDGTTRLELAREALHDLTTRRPVSDEWMLIEAGREPQVLQTWTRDRRAIRQAAATIRPYAGASDLASARELAAELLAGKKRPTVVMLSDGGAGRALPEDEAEPAADDDKTLVYWPIGRSDDNLGLTRFRVRPHRQQSAHHAFVRLVNASSQDVETQIVFDLDGATTAVEPLSVEAGGTWEKTVVFNSPEGGVLRAWIDRPDALALDDQAYAILAPIEPAAVLLVSPPEDAFFFEQALAAMDPLVALEASRTMTIQAYDGLGALTEQPDLTIFNNCLPAALPESGRYVFVNGWPAEVPARVVGTLEMPEMTVAKRDHPLTSYLNLRPVRLAAALEVDLAERATVLARSSEGVPLIFLYEQPGRQILCLAFDVLESDLPFRNSFPLFLRNAVAFLGTEQRAWIRDQYRVGDPVEPLRSLPMDVHEVNVAQLSGEEVLEETLPVRQGTFLFHQTEKPGPLRFTIGDEVAYTAVNLADEGESRILPMPAPVPPEQLLPLSDSLFGTVPWLALATLATLLIGMEWLTYHMRWTE